jgi:hypothetical protein
MWEVGEQHVAVVQSVSTVYGEVVADSCTMHISTAKVCIHCAALTAVAQ